MIDSNKDIFYYFFNHLFSSSGKYFMCDLFLFGCFYIHFFILIAASFRVGKSRFTVVSLWNTEFILILLFIKYYIIFHTNNCLPTFAHHVYSGKNVAPIGVASLISFLFLIITGKCFKHISLAIGINFSASYTHFPYSSFVF